MKRLFNHKPKSSKLSKDFGEDTQRQQQQFNTPIYQKLATQSPHIHGTHISQPSLLQSTHQIPSPTEDEWNQQSTQVINTPPPIIRSPSRSNSLNSLPQAPSATLPAPPRSASPMSTVSMGVSRHRPPDQERKVAPSALGILGSLNPPRGDGALRSGGGRMYSEERSQVQTITPSEVGHAQVPEKKRAFWSRDKDKDKEKEKALEREREREKEIEWHREMQQRKEEYDRGFKERGREDSQAELTRMIGYLTATASEDWSLVLEVCERASKTESAAKEAVRALRREFKYGEPAAQLSAARLWAIMLRNSSENFITQSTSRKFLETIEDLLSSPRTSPVVRERLLEVVAAAAFASGSKKGSDRDGFRGLWKRVKPNDKPDEGVPFNTEDAMFQPPQSGRQSAHDVPVLKYQEASPLPQESNPPTPTPRSIKERRSPSRGDRIIPRDEDIRRLFQECKIGLGNASVLSDALAGTKPEDLNNQGVIKEFYNKCRASQELINSQIPWATSIAEHSRINKIQQVPQHARKRTISNTNGVHVDAKDIAPAPPLEVTTEERLLESLLAANAELMQSLTQWDDLYRIAMEKKVAYLSKKEAKMERKEYESSISTIESSIRDHSPPSRSQSPFTGPRTAASHSSHSDSRTNHARHPSIQDLDSDGSVHSQQNLAPPPLAPHGPRLPIHHSAPLHSRTPSPTPVNTQFTDERGVPIANSDSSLSPEDEEPPMPSAKALGKKKAPESDPPADNDFDPDDIYYPTGHFAQPNRQSTLTIDDTRWRPPPVKYAYDAVAERTRQLLLESGASNENHQKPVNGIH